MSRKLLLTLYEAERVVLWRAAKTLELAQLSWPVRSNKGFGGISLTVAAAALDWCARKQELQVRLPIPGNTRSTGPEKV